MRMRTHQDARVDNMRTTIDLADDVAAEVARLRRERGLGLSEAVNELARAGLRVRPEPYVYEHKSYNMGAHVDLTNVGRVLDLLDEYDAADRQKDSRRAG